MSVEEQQSSPRFLPYWRGPIEGYTVKQIRKLYPAVSTFYEYQDLYQESYTVYLRCKTYYRGKQTLEPKWFMAFYKSCLANHFANLIKKSRRVPGLVSMELEPIMSTVDAEGELSVSLEQLPSELAEVLRLLVTSAGELVGTRRTAQARQQLEEHLA